MSGFAFWDTNLLIYWMEGTPRWSPAAKALYDWQVRERIRTVTSSLGLAEILVRPLSLSDAKVARSYAGIISEMGCLPFGPDEAWRFAELRARYPKLRPPDAIQLACASIFGVDYFFTNDDRLSRLKVEGIVRIESLAAWAAKEAGH